MAAEILRKEQVTKKKNLLQLRHTQARYFSEECLYVSFLERPQPGHHYEKLKFDVCLTVHH